MTITLMQYKGISAQRTLIEMVWTVMFLKSPRSAYLVAMGRGLEKGALVNPHEEWTFTKVITIFSEVRACKSRIDEL